MARFRILTLSPALLLLASCGSSTGTGAGSVAGGDFAVENISISQGEQRWRINRPIDLLFTEAVDFATVGLNTVRITDPQGRPATGTFVQPAVGGSVDPRLVRFQPACPTLSDNSDAGFRPGTDYRLVVAGGASGGVTVRSTAGESLNASRTVEFRTPPADAPSSELFIDTVPGPPGVRLRGQGGLALTELDATYLELGGDPDERVYFELDATTQTGLLPGNFELPLNKYSDQGSQVAVMVFLNQPLQPSAENFGTQRVRLEYRDPRVVGDEWQIVPTQGTLLANCTDTGALLRLEPEGILPQGTFMRVILDRGFSDLAGQVLDVPRDHFARMTVGVANNPAATDPSLDADELFEPFLISGTASGSFEDVGAAFAVPPAEWGGGLLSASFAFQGTGGSGGGFDWDLQPNVTVIVDTVSDIITGSSGNQTVIGGLIDVRNLRIPSTSRVIFQGPNPVRILATGMVRVDGEISVRGTNSQGVSTLNTTNFPEPGGSGQAGGGDGGVGSFLTSQSTPRGGTGFGAFNSPGGGGQGGESGFAPGNANARRAAGGGGGRFGLDVFYPFADSTGMEHFVLCQTLIGMDAEIGRGGSMNATGAISQIDRPMGGAVGPDPFVDASEENNFFGAMLVDPGQPGERLILGELNRVWAGPGGGAGGDAVQSASFPLVPFTNGGDEKGAGGGGGGGSLSIYSIGPIIVTANGRIVADGGCGGGGENTNFFDRVAGGSGGGAGGHIVMSSANYIELAGVANNAGDYYNDPIVTIGNVHGPRQLSSLGGQGGAGRGGSAGDRGGNGNQGHTTWKCDSIFRSTLEVPVTNGNGSMEILRIPPRDENCQNNNYPQGQHDIGDPLGPSLAAGGEGSPGIIQLHVDNPALNLRFPGLQTGDVMSGFVPAYGAGLDVTKTIVPPPMGWKGLDDAEQMVPFFGAQSVAQSIWIPLGLARINPDPSQPGELLPDEQVRFRFDGTLAGTGEVATNPDGDVVLAAPIIGPDGLGNAPATPYIVAGSGGTRMVLDGSGLMNADEIFLRSAGLLRGFVVRLESASATQDFSIAAAELDSSAVEFTVTVSTAGGTLDAFVAQAGGPVQVSVIPHFFRVETNGVPDSMPVDAAIAVFFDATLADTSGNPNPDLAFSNQPNGMGQPQGFATDVTALNAQNWDFFRFRVEFNLSTTGGGVNLTTPRPGLRFLSVPFEY